MALTGYPFPYDVNNLTGGRTRILYAPTSQAIPANMDDIFEMDGGGYVVKGSWLDLGATKEASSYARGFDTGAWEIQQVVGAVVEEVTDVTRTLTVSFADFKPEHLQIIENAPSIATLAAAAGRSAQKQVSFGAFSSITRYRFAFVQQRSKQSGIVTESAGAGSGTRGRFLCGVLYDAQISADEVTFEQAKGELTGVGVTFTGFPASGQPTGQEYGTWLDELAGTIT